MRKFYTARYDRVFKTIICNEENPIYLKKILESILKEEIENIEILKNELAINSIDERLKIVDLLVKIQNKYIHVELNSNYNDRIKYRNFIYFTSIMSSKTKRGHEYKYDGYIHIDLTYGMEDETEIREYYIQDNNHNKYINNVKIIEINMDKVTKLCYVKSEYRYIGMLDLEPKELKKLAKDDEVVKEYSKEVEKLNEKEEFQSFMTQEEQAEWLLEGFKADAREEGLEEGLEKGREEANILIIKKLLEKNMSVEQISDLLDISVTDIREMLNKNVD